MQPSIALLQIQWVWASIPQCSNPPSGALAQTWAPLCGIREPVHSCLLSGSVTHSESSRKIPKRGNLIVHIFFFASTIIYFFKYIFFIMVGIGSDDSVLYMLHIYMCVCVCVYIYFFFRVIFLINVNSNDELRGLIRSTLPWAQHCVPTTVLSIFFGLVKWINKAPTFLV